MSDLQERDHTLDYPHELYPTTQHVEDRSEVQPVRLPSGELVHAPASNVDDDGVAHFLLITPDPSEPDLCGGCKKEWPCEKRVGVEVLEQPAPTIDKATLDAVLQALRDEREAGRLAL